MLTKSQSIIIIIVCYWISLIGLHIKLDTNKYIIDNLIYHNITGIICSTIFLNNNKLIIDSYVVLFLVLMFESQLKINNIYMFACFIQLYFLICLFKKYYMLSIVMILTSLVKLYYMFDIITYKRENEIIFKWLFNCSIFMLFFLLINWFSSKPIIKI